MTADDSARLAQALARCDELLELDPAERAAALATLAARDPELARRVSSLLAADSDAGDYLERPAGEKDQDETRVRLDAPISSFDVPDHVLPHGALPLLGIPGRRGSALDMPELPES